MAKYGKVEVAVATALVVAIYVVALWLLWPDSRPKALALAAVMLIIAVVYIWVLYFFRDPERAIPEGSGLFVSPADGTVTDITQLGADSVLGSKGIQIGIFMNIFDVHVNRSPADTTVQRVVHRGGTFLDARNPQATSRNESATIYLKHSRHGKDFLIVVRQVAGLIARRIVTDLHEGQQLNRGHRIGMIKFGSRVELAIPHHLRHEIRVKVGQRVRAGETVLISASEESN